MTAETREILTNKEVIAVDQDALGMQGRRVKQENGGEVWVKQLKDGSRAVVLLNRNEKEQEIRLQWEDLGYPHHLTAAVRDLWEHKSLGSFTGEFSAKVAPHGVEMVVVQP